MVGARLLVVCGQMTSHLVLARPPLLLQAFKGTSSQEAWKIKTREANAGKEAAKRMGDRDNQGNSVDRRGNESKPHDWPFSYNTHSITTFCKTVPLHGDSLLCSCCSGHRNVMQVWGAGKVTATSHKEVMEGSKCCSALFCFMKGLMNPFVQEGRVEETSSGSVTELIAG